jgi:hypothetical protein
VTLASTARAIESTASVLTGKRWASLPASKRALRLATRVLGDGAAAVGEFQVALEGEWTGHPGGAFRITEEDIDCMVEVFNAQKTPLQVDFNHSSVPDDRVPTPEEGKAAGWITSLCKRMGERGAELWADVVEWGAEAAEYIRKGEYAFCSPVLLFESTDRVTGESVPARLFNVALTNVPFLDGMAPVRLSETAPPKPEDEEEEPVTDPEAPPVDETADTEPPEEEIESAEEGEPMEGEEPEPGTQDGEEPSGDTASASAALIDDMAKQCGGVDSATVVDVMRRHFDAFARAVNETLEREQAQKASQAQVVSMADKTDDKEARLAAIEARKKDELLLKMSERLEALDKKLTDREARDEAERKALADAAVKAKVDGLVKTGHVLESERDDAMFMFSTAPERAARVYAVKRVPLGETQAGTEGAAAPVDADRKLTLSDVPDDGTRQAAKTILAMTHIGAGGVTVRLSEDEACRKAIAQVAKMRKAG